MVIDILVALGIVAAVSVFFGILLALVTFFFDVPEDEKTKSIRACLPGINCGACGFKGCNDYAQALARGVAQPNRCIPGGESVAAQLGDILGVSVEAMEATVAFVHCNGDCDAAHNKAAYDGLSTCRARDMLYGGPKACTYGCLGCGDCARVCEAQAICMANGIAHIDPTRCVGCGACAKACPKKIISMIPKAATTMVYCSSHDKGADARRACANACIGCKKCEKQCPAQAISVVNNCATIDYTKCTGCGLCAAGCPTGCLKSLNSPANTSD